jgi:hypothetical protein
MGSGLLSRSQAPASNVYSLQLLTWKNAFMSLLFGICVYSNVRFAVLDKDISNAVIAQNVENDLAKQAEPPTNDEGWVTIQVFAGKDDILMEARNVQPGQWHAQVE